MDKKVSFVIESMMEQGFNLPPYVREKSAEFAETPFDANPISIDISSQKNTWLSAVKLACGPFSDIQIHHYSQKIADAAARYKILDDIKEAAIFIEKMDANPRQIRTQDSWQQTKAWLIKNAEYISGDIRENIVDHLFEKAAELDYQPSLSEMYELNSIAGRETDTPEMRKLIEDNIYKLASGNYYTTEQFESLPFEEVQEYFPAEVKRASFEMPVIGPSFARVAESMDLSQALVLDRILQKHGQFPLYNDEKEPLEISDEILAALPDYPLDKNAAWWNPLSKDFVLYPPWQRQTRQKNVPTNPNAVVPQGKGGVSGSGMKHNATTNRKAVEALSTDGNADLPDYSGNATIDKSSGKVVPKR